MRGSSSLSDESTLADFSTPLKRVQESLTASAHSRVPYWSMAGNVAEPFPFMRLPPELRTKIYHLVLESNNNLQATFVRCFTANDRVTLRYRIHRTWTRIKWDDDSKPNSPALALACKTTKTEIESIIVPYVEYCFYSTPPWYRSEFSSPFSTATFLANLRYLSLSLEVVSTGNWMINESEADDSDLQEASRTVEILRGDVGAQLVQLTLNTTWGSWDDKESMCILWLLLCVDLPRVRRIALLVDGPQSEADMNQWKAFRYRGYLYEEAKEPLEELKIPPKGQIIPTHERSDGTFINFVRASEEEVVGTASNAVAATD